MPGYSPAMAAAAVRSVDSLTSKGTKLSSLPASRSAERSTRVFSEVPEPSSTSVVAPDIRTISSAWARRISRSLLVG